ncbi:MAG: hypothetical protein HY329_06065 [Chloroflexi bacterium]|nr:hypothetical protein [Chloroflexota bacterium]
MIRVRWERVVDELVGVRDRDRHERRLSWWRISGTLGASRPDGTLAGARQRRGAGAASLAGWPAVPISTK